MQSFYSSVKSSFNTQFPIIEADYTITINFYFDLLLD